MLINPEKCNKTTLNCKNEIEIKLIPSYHCDLNCKYCYNKYISNNYQQNYKKLKNSLSEFLLKNESNTIVEIIGGEPLSSCNYDETKSIIDYLFSLQRNIKVVLQTGSSNIEKLDKMIPKIDGLSYSIDLSNSPKASNLKNLENITKICKDNDVSIQIQTLLSPTDSLESIYKFINVCTLYGVGWIGIEYPNYQRYSKEELDAQIYVYSTLITHLKQFEDISVGGAIIESVVDFFSGYKYSSPCMCGEKSITIQPDGSVSPSLHFEPIEFPTLDDYIEKKFYREQLLRKGNCSECKIWDVCLGGCMGHAKFLTGDFYKPDKEFCYLLLGVIKKLKSWNR